MKYGITLRWPRLLLSFNKDHSLYSQHWSNIEDDLDFSCASSKGSSSDNGGSVDSGQYAIPEAANEGLIYSRRTIIIRKIYTGS